MPERSLTCTPSALLAVDPCLGCLSEKELLAALVGVMATGYGITVPNTLKNSACFTCLSKKQMLQALVSIIGNELMTEGDIGSLISSISCLECASEKQLLAALLYLICNNLELTPV